MFVVVCLHVCVCVFVCVHAWVHVCVCVCVCALPGNHSLYISLLDNSEVDPD